MYVISNPDNSSEIGVEMFPFTDLENNHMVTKGEKREEG